MGAEETRINYLCGFDESWRAPRRSRGLKRHSGGELSIQTFGFFFLFFFFLVVVGGGLLIKKERAETGARCVGFLCLATAFFSSFLSFYAKM